MLTSAHVQVFGGGELKNFDKPPVVLDTARQYKSAGSF